MQLVDQGRLSLDTPLKDYLDKPLPAFDLATGWHQYRNDPAVSTTVWYRSGQPKGAPWTNQWDWTDPAVDKVIEANADVAQKVRDGKVQAVGALIGQVMRETRNRRHSSGSVGMRSPGA